MGVEQFVHVVIGGLGTEVLVDLHHGRVLVRGRQTESLAELGVLAETSQTGLDDHITTGNEVADCVAAHSNGGNAETGDLKKTAATQDQGCRTLGVVVIFREHYLIPCEKIRHAAGAEASG